MTSNVATARDECAGLAKAKWAALGQDEARLLWQDKPSDQPKDTDSHHAPRAWARFTMTHAAAPQTAMGNGAYAGARRKYTNSGVINVQVFTPSGKGLSTADVLGPGMRDAFRGVATASGVWFRNARSVEVGPDGDWYQTNVTVEFEYDEVG